MRTRVKRFRRKLRWLVGPVPGLVLLLIGMLFICRMLEADEPVHIPMEPIIASVLVQAEEETPPPPEEEAAPPVSIIVNIPATSMTLYEDGKPLFTKPIAIGSGVYPTPVQESAIKKVEWNPWWYPPPDAEWAAGEKPTPPGPGNPLGRVKMAISDAILFHGTNKESTVGRPASHGCMRMYNSDAEELAWFLQSNFSDKSDPSYLETYQKHRRTTYVVALNSEVPVRLVYQPVLVKDGTLYLYPDYYRRIANKKAAVISALESDGIDVASLDEGKVNDLIKSWAMKRIEVQIDSLKPSQETPEGNQ